jgi:hypothetical protein
MAHKELQADRQAVGVDLVLIVSARPLGNSSQPRRGPRSTTFQTWNAAQIQHGSHLDADRQKKLGKRCGQVSFGICESLEASE